MAFKLPGLPFAETALAPWISAETLKYHYGKHHAAYINKLNDLVRGTENERKTLRELVEGASGVMYNQAAQAWNHDFYWKSLSPNGGGAPSGALGSKINEDFGSFQEFKQTFTAAAAGHFGSGWAWLCLDKHDDKLKVIQTHDAGNPIRDGTGIPLLVCDVWEHAYYIDYRNDRAKYIEAWWNLVNWDFAASNLAEIKKPVSTRNDL